MPEPSATSSSADFRGARWLPYAALSLLALLIYSPTFSNEFVWDDLDYIVQNYRIQGLSPAHWRAVWLAPYAAQYAPVHQALLALLYQLGGLDPLVYHVAQVLLHAACAGLLFALLLRTETPAVAAIAAALFVVHPANIENVACATETKSTLALLFFLISALFFLRLDGAARRRDAICCVVFFALSLLSKASTVVGPAALLLLALRQGRQSCQSLLPRSRLWCLAALFALSTALTLVTLHLQQSISVEATPDRLTDATLLRDGATHLRAAGKYYGGWAIHLLNLPGLLLHYLQTALWPAQLSIWRMFAVETGWSARALACWAGLLAALGALGWAWFTERGRTVAFWGAWFLLFLAPVLQIFPNPAWVADRYLYIPAIGLFVIFSTLVVGIAERASDERARKAVLALPALAVLALIWGTTRHLPVWKNEVTLWSGAMSTCAKSAYCHGTLSNALRRQAWREQGEQRQRLRRAAVEEAAAAVRIRPTHAKWIYLGDALSDAGDPRALAAYQKTREILGRIPLLYWTQIAKAHYRFGNVAEAARVLATLQPAGGEDPNALMVQAFVAWKQGQFAEARAAVEKIMAMNTLFPPGPERAFRFISHYWGDAVEARAMLAEVHGL